MSHPEVSQAAVLEELDRIVKSADFGKAERPARFLRHLVETALRNEPQLLKESLIGVDVFGREPAWDPRLDPVVRQEAARLRKRLVRYYEVAGSSATVRIELPVGSYVPVFVRPEQPLPAHSIPVASTQRKWLPVAVPAAVGILVVLGWISFRPATHDAKVRTEAEELYLRGLYSWQKRTPESLNYAVDQFTQAIVRDPHYALAYVGLAKSYNLLREYSAMPEEDAYPRALAATQKALELDEKSAEAHTSLAFISFFWKWNAAAAEREYRRAIELDPQSAVAHHWYGSFLQHRGRFAEAMDQVNIAQKLEPTSTAILATKAMLLHYTGQSDAAISLLRQIASQDPTGQASHRNLAFIYLVRKDYPSYLAEFEKYAGVAGNPVQQTLFAAAKGGFTRAGAGGMFEETLAAEVALNREGKRPSYWLAETCGFMGREKEAIAYLEKSSAEPGSLFLAYRTDPAFDSFRNDPAFQAIDARFEPRIAAGTYPSRQ